MITMTTKGFDKLNAFLRDFPANVKNEVIKTTKRYARTVQNRIKRSILFDKYPVGPNDPRYREWKEQASNVPYAHPLAATGEYAKSIKVHKEKRYKGEILKLRIGPDNKPRRTAIPFTGGPGGPAQTKLDSRRKVAEILADDPKYRHMVLEADKTEKDIVNETRDATERAIKKSIR